jgi:hypothetical protein
MVMNLKTKFGKARAFYNLKKIFSFDNYSRKIELNELQKEVVELAKRVLSKKDTDLLVSPETGMLYARWEHITLKISHKGDEIVVMNGKYYYYFYLPPEEISNVRKRFYRSVAHRQGIWENKFNEHALSNIKEILKEIEQEK